MEQRVRGDLLVGNFAVLSVQPKDSQTLFDQGGEDHKEAKALRPASGVAEQLCRVRWVQKVDVADTDGASEQSGKHEYETALSDHQRVSLGDHPANNDVHEEVQDSGEGHDSNSSRRWGGTRHKLWSVVAGIAFLHLGWVGVGVDRVVNADQRSVKVGVLGRSNNGDTQRGREAIRVLERKDPGWSGYRDTIQIDAHFDRIERLCQLDTLRPDVDCAVRIHHVAGEWLTAVSSKVQGAEHCILGDGDFLKVRRGCILVGHVAGDLALVDLSGKDLVLYGEGFHCSENLRRLGNILARKGVDDDDAGVSAVLDGSDGALEHVGVICGGREEGRADLWDRKPSAYAIASWLSVEFWPIK
ncbi:hypothetical protein HDV06_005898 [Boothiomyces sp. JEL0866]|nr:hypothetical protein HDV06_000447 [Boothiomyces sp. JEL0866]KAJ3319777.1 hypothetical protein HDV06_005898 [Boothiomyces sp. JEL0866]